jgi:LysM repeat protein
MDTRHRSPARILAPIALVAFGLALLIILATAGGSDHSSSSSAPTRAEQRDLRLKRSRARRAAAAAKRTDTLPQTVYVVKTGDTLASIAQKTGVPVEKLQELNPNLDPQALVSGQRLKLR